MSCVDDINTRLQGARKDGTIVCDGIGYYDKADDVPHPFKGLSAPIPGLSHLCVAWCGMLPTPSNWAYCFISPQLPERTPVETTVRVLCEDLSADLYPRPVGSSVRGAREDRRAGRDRHIGPDEEQREDEKQRERELLLSETAWAEQAEMGLQDLNSDLET